MKKIYIAGAITKLPKEVYKAKFDAAKKELKTMGVIPVSPIDLPHDHDKQYNSYMKECISSMVKCDGVYALDNWHTSKGAYMEIELAMKLKIPIVYQRDVYRIRERAERGDKINDLNCRIANINIQIHSSFDSLIPFIS